MYFKLKKEKFIWLASRSAGRLLFTCSSATGSYSQCHLFHQVVLFLCPSLHNDKSRLTSRHYVYFRNRHCSNCGFIVNYSRTPFKSIFINVPWKGLLKRRISNSIFTLLVKTHWIATWTWRILRIVWLAGQRRCFADSRRHFINSIVWHSINLRLVTASAILAGSELLAPSTMSGFFISSLSNYIKTTLLRLTKYRDYCFIMVIPNESENSCRFRFNNNENVSSVGR